MLETKNIRNIAIVAHVKTSLIDQRLRQADALSRRERSQHLVIDCNEQEQAVYKYFPE